MPQTRYQSIYFRPPPECILLLYLFCTANFLAIICSGQQQLPEGNGNSALRTIVLKGSVLDSENTITVMTPLRLEISSGTGFVKAVEFVGTFEVNDLLPGAYNLEVTQIESRFPIGKLAINASADISTVQIYVHLFARLSGQVMTPGNKPANARVLLLAKEYWFGKMTCYVEKQFFTDRQGKYRFENVMPGRTYFVLVLPLLSNQEAALDREVVPGKAIALAGTWFPGIPDGDQTTGFSLTSGEEREINMQMIASPSRCVDGITTFDGRPASMQVEIDVNELSDYSPKMGLMTGQVDVTKSDHVGKFRFCDLWPGMFVIKAGLSPQRYGYSSVVLLNKDITGIRVDVRRPIEVRGEIEWDTNESTSLTSIIFTPISRPAMVSEEFPQLKTSQSQSFGVSLTAMTQYLVSLDGLPNSYLKQISCGNRIIRGNRIDPNEGCSLRIVIGTDISVVTAIMVDGDGHSVKSGRFCLVPDSAMYIDEVAGEAICSEVSEYDSSTDHPSLRVPPGRYYGIALTTPQEANWARDLWLNTANATRIIATPGSSVETVLVCK